LQQWEKVVENDSIKKGEWVGTLAVGLHLVTWCALCFGLYYCVPWYKKVFMDFGVELSADTLLLIQVSDLVVKYFYLLLAALAVFAVVDANIVNSFESQTSRWLWLGLMLAVPLCAILAVVVCISMLMRSLPADLQ